MIRVSSVEEQEQNIMEIEWLRQLKGYEEEVFSIRPDT